MPHAVEVMAALLRSLSSDPDLPPAKEKGCARRDGDFALHLPGMGPGRAFDTGFRNPLAPGHEAHP